MNPKRYIDHYSVQNIDQSDIDMVISALKGDIITGGEYVKRFESEIKDILNVKYAFSCSSATAALHLSSLAVGLSPNDFVIVPTITFAATANIPKLIGANIVFADVDPDNGLLTEKTLEDAIKNSPVTPKIVYPVHLSGQACNMRGINRVCQKYGISIIEDAAHAFGGKYNGKYIGSYDYSSATCFSFHPVKPITMGEGGCVTTNDKTIAQKIMKLRSHGIERDAKKFKHHDQAYDNKQKLGKWYYEIHNLGLNYRSSDLNCALGLSQLKKATNFIKVRRNLAEIYDKNFQSFSDLITPCSRYNKNDDAYHLYPILIDFDKFQITRQDFIEHLETKGIGTQVHYIPVHQQPFYKSLYGDNFLCGANSYYKKTISIPLHTKLTAFDIETISEEIIQYLISKNIDAT